MLLKYVHYYHKAIVWSCLGAADAAFTASYALQSYMVFCETFPSFIGQTKHTVTEELFIHPTFCSKQLTILHCLSIGKAQAPLNEFLRLNTF